MRDFEMKSAILELGRIRRSRFILAALILVATAIGVGYSLASPDETPSQNQELQTTTVRRGDLILYASGSGTLIVADEISLGFGTAGEIEAIYVDAGDQVVTGDPLAVQAEIDQLALAAEEARLAVIDAEESLQDLMDSADLVAAQALSDLGVAQEALSDMERTWSVWQEGNRASTSTLQAAEAELNQSKEEMERAEERAHDCGSSSDSECAQAYKDYAAAVQRYNTALANYNWYTGSPTEGKQNELDGELALAQARVVEAEAYHNSVKNGPDPGELARAESNLAMIEYNLAIAEQNLALANLTAPIDGTVLEVAADVGDTVSGPFLTLADLSSLFLNVHLDETDVGKIAVGYEVEVIFDALPDQSFTGEIVRVYPSLSESGQVSTVQAVAQLEVDPGNVTNLMLGMNAAVNVIAGRAENALLVPTDALLELTPGEYAVFVMEQGSPKLRTIEVGIVDFTFAEVLSGLEVGEVVTTGIVETQ